MLPFVTRSDLEAAAQQADVSMETRNHLLNKLLHEHGQTGIRNQLQSLLTEWVEKHHVDLAKVQTQQENRLWPFFSALETYFFRRVIWVESEKNMD